MNLFKDFYFLNRILVGKLHPQILEEIENFVEVCRKYKTDELGFLRDHLNVGKNSYQFSVPSPMVEKSYTYPYLIKLGEYYLNSTGTPINPLHRPLRLRRYVDHFDGFDFWVNFTNSGDENPLHKHSGTLSAVIYIANNDRIPTRFEDGSVYAGEPGDIVIFPADLEHWVEKHELTAERITLSFNLQLA